MTEPTPDVLHRNALIPEQAGATMPEIVEADALKTIEFEELREFLGDPARIDTPTIPSKINIAIPAPRLVFFLFEGFEILLCLRREGEHPQTPHRLGPIFPNRAIAAVDVRIRHRVADLHPVIDEIDRLRDFLAP